MNFETIESAGRPIKSWMGGVPIEHIAVTR